jgi:glycosyltransferase involved in cell wall biosynthesis
LTKVEKAAAAKVTTSIAGLKRVAPAGTDVHAFPASQFPNRFLRLWKLFWSARNSDHLIMDFDVAELTALKVLGAVFGRGGGRLTTLDLFIGAPGRKDLWRVRWAVRSVNRLLIYFRETEAFEKLLDAPASKFRYIPFKINGLELIQSMRPSEDGYIFCGGRSRRDFRTLFEAVKDLPYPVKVVTSDEASMRPHGSTMEGLTVPPNVEIILRDSDQPFFLECMAHATLVVLPLVKDTLTQAGIGVYIQAMALRKCVIVSAGLGVRDVLSDEAVMPPPGDADALRRAIQTIWENPVERRAYAQRGYDYAIRLGGEDDLYKSIFANLPD